MSQLGVASDLPAREKKSRKRKNEDNTNQDNIFESVNDFIAWSNTTNNTANTATNNNNNPSSDPAASIPPNPNELVQKIHDFNTKTTEDEDAIKASEYLRQLRSQNADEDGNDSSSSSHNTEDPLLTLLRIEAKEKDKPTTIEYDDRVYDKKIFQDEEFKEYRKNNVATAQKPTFLYQDTDKIVHRKPQTHNSDENTINSDAIVHPYEPEYDDTTHDAIIQKRVGKMRPNFFIALKITDMKLKRKLCNAQQLLLKELNDNTYEQAMIDDSTFHITINAIYCEDDDEVFHLINMFEQFGTTTLQKLVPTKLSARLHVNGLDHFRQKVIYGHIEDDAHKQKLENVFHALHTQFQKAGIVNQQHKFDPHLTIMKLSKIVRNRPLTIPLSVIEKLNSKYNKSLDFGYQYVNGLELLSMSDERNEEDSDDYYQCISTIAPLRLR